MSFLTRNLEALRQVRPDLADRLSGAAAAPDLEVRPARSGAMTGHYRGRSLCSRYNPRDEAERQLSRLPLARASVVVFWGVGLGHSLKRYLDGHWEKGCHVLAVESEPVLVKTALELHDFTEPIASGALTFIVGRGNFSGYIDYLVPQQRFILAAAACVQVEHPMLTSLFNEFYRAAKLTFFQAVHHEIKGLGNDPNDGLIGVVNFLSNIPTILEKPGLNQVTGAFAGHPGIVVSAGPSLAGNIHLLPEVSERAVIVSCDAVLKSLIARGFHPHLSVAIERQPETSEFFRAIPLEKVQDTFAVSTPISDPSLYETYRGPHVIVYRTGHKFGLLPVEKGTIHTGHSVANLAFKVTEMMGCDPIILIGQDLAYGPGEKTHWDGADYAAMWMAKRDYAKYAVPGNYQETVLTNKVWDTFRKQFEIDISAYAGRCINATEGGARIAGTKLMSFRDVMQTYLPADIKPLECLKRHLAPPPEREILAVRQQVLERLREVTRSLRATIAGCRAVCGRADHFLQSRESMPLSEQIKAAGPIMRYNTELCDVDRELDFLVTNLTSMIQTQNQIESVRLFHRIADMSTYLKEIISCSKVFYHRYGELTALLLTRIEETLQRLSAQWT